MDISPHTDNSQLYHLNIFLSQWEEKENGIKVFTSGSTGHPKAIVLSRSQIERSARRTNRFFGINRNSRLHCAISFEFIGGKMMIARSMMARCKLTFSSPSLHPSIPEEKDGVVDLMAVVPAQMPYILDNLSNFSHVKTFMLGGSAIPDTLWHRIVASGINAWETYGMTETASHIALRRIKGQYDNRPRFVPLPDIRISTDLSDCLHIIDGDIALSTNDIARVYPDSSFEIIGRNDDMIITGGLKVHPVTIEKVLHEYLDERFNEFFITAKPDELWTSRIVLAVVVKDKTREEEKVIAEIRSLISSIPYTVLSKKFRPKEILIIPYLPATPSGKLLRKL